jgi:hypothetical protein
MRYYTGHYKLRHRAGNIAVILHYFNAYSIVSQLHERGAQFDE